MLREVKKLTSVRLLQDKQVYHVIICVTVRTGWRYGGGYLSTITLRYLSLNTVYTFSDGYLVGYFCHAC